MKSLAVQLFLIFTIAFGAIVFAFYLIYQIFSGTLSPAHNPVSRGPSLKFPDSEAPAAGACGFAGGDTAFVAIREDVPSPRCVRVSKDQKLRVTNNTGEDIKIWFDGASPALLPGMPVAVPRGEDYVIERSFGKYLERGVHRLSSAPFPGPEIWLVDGSGVRVASGKTFCERLNEERRKRSGIDDAIPKSSFSRGKHAPVDFSSNPQAREFRTRINEAMTGGPNFAGHYVVASWGCGMGCQRSAVVDAENGKIIAFQIPSEMGVSYAIASRTLIANPKESFPHSDETPMDDAEMSISFARIPRQYYELVEVGEDSYLSAVCVESATEGVYSF